MTPAGELLRDEAARAGPLAFSRFMEVALYHPQCGYYRAGRDPFGTAGDFYTAAQLQPVFGRLLAAWFRKLRHALGEPADFAVVEWGAGRTENAEHLGEFAYTAIDEGRGTAPQSFEGVVFSNELFDALPVDVVRVRDGVARMMRVACSADRFEWCEGEEVAQSWQDYIEGLRRHFGDDERELWFELPVTMAQVLERMCAGLRRGHVIAIDYGYTEREVVRFPSGTLMGYRKHQAHDDVLCEPGLRDITAHVAFTHLEHLARGLGLRVEGLPTLARTLLDVGADDQFAEALQAPDEAAAQRLRLQLKTLLFGLGETFRCLHLVR